MFVTGYRVICARIAALLLVLRPTLTQLLYNQLIGFTVEAFLRKRHNTNACSTWNVNIVSSSQPGGSYTEKDDIEASSRKESPCRSHKRSRVFR